MTSISKYWISNSFYWNIFLLVVFTFFCCLFSDLELVISPCLSLRNVRIREEPLCLLPPWLQFVPEMHKNNWLRLRLTYPSSVISGWTMRKVFRFPALFSNSKNIFLVVPNKKKKGRQKCRGNKWELKEATETQCGYLGPVVYSQVFVTISGKNICNIKAKFTNTSRFLPTKNDISEEGE